MSSIFGNNPLISVGIPFYNDENYLAYAIQSVICQSYENWELILIDDGSNDNSLQIAKKIALKDKRIKVISDGKNKKLPHRLNQLINESKGDFIARMDADDIMHTDRLLIQLTYLKNNPCLDLVSSGLVSIDAQNNICGFRSTSKIITNLSIDKGFPIIHPSVMARKEWYLRNLYDESYSRSQDYELWCRSFTNNDLKIAILPDLLLFYREFGNIDLTKLIKSYNNGYKIREKYYLNNGIDDFLKIKVKCLMVKLLSKFGLEQNLAKKRNRSFSSITEEKELQAVVNTIVNKSLT